jgi:putative ABC transport system permease protein
MAKQTASIDVLVYTLMVMAVLIALVGGLGLMGTMSMNVMERNREIGVMRAIGASDFTVQQMVIVEGMVIGVISWFLGALLAFPISLVLDYIVGIAFVTSPLDFIISPYGFMIWLAGVLILSALASYLPARSASRLTVREVLAYE